MNNPLVPSVVFDFPTAIKYIIDGRRVTKLEWRNKNIFLHLSEGFLRIHKADGTSDRLLVSDGDLLGRDWTVLDELRDQ